MASLPIPKCSVLHTRQVTIPDCKEDAPEYCTRTYHLSLPDILCGEAGTDDHHRRLQQNVRRAANGSKFFEGEYKKVGTVPMVFAFHGTGTDYEPMSGYAETANEHNFVLVLPEGINKSFNAGDCCGDAHVLGIHDVDFINHIQQMLSEEFDFLLPEYSYGIGWDNGGLLLTDATIESPHLFRAIVPIAGYSMRTWTPPSIGNGIGIMMHHSLDDLIIRPSGCCDDPNMPVCQGDGLWPLLVTTHCDSVLDSFDLWARSVNLCTSDNEESGANNNSRTLEHGDDKKTLLMGGGGGIVYLLKQEAGFTSLAYVSVSDNKDEDPPKELSISNLPLAVTYTHEGVVCLTTASESCVANSTLCLYKEMSHFEGFISTPFMGNQVMDFLAHDACGTNGGLWETIKSSDIGFCKCTGGIFNGVFCLDKPDDDLISGVSRVQTVESVPTESKARMPAIGALGLVLLVATVIVFVTKKTFTRNNGDNSPSTMYDDTPISVSIPNITLPDQLYKVKTNFESGMSGQNRGWKPWKKKKEAPTRGLRRRLSEGHMSDDDRSCGLDTSERSDSSVGSLKSLDAIDKQLLQFYRKKSEGTEPTQFNRKKSAGSESVASHDEIGLDIDKELLNTYRRRKMEKHAYSKDTDEASRRQSDNSSLTENLCSINQNSHLYADLFSGDKSYSDDDKDADDSDDGDENDGEKSRKQNNQYIRSILWDVAMS